MEYRVMACMVVGFVTMIAVLYAGAPLPHTTSAKNRLIDVGAAAFIGLMAALATFVVLSLVFDFDYTGCTMARVPE